MFCSAALSPRDLGALFPRAPPDHIQQAHSTVAHVTSGSTCADTKDFDPPFVLELATPSLQWLRRQSQHISHLENAFLDNPPLDSGLEDHLLDGPPLEALP